MVVAILMVYEFHFALYGKPVGVYVEETHKDAYHQALVVEVGVFLYLFYHDNLAVGGSYHNLACVALEISLRATEEVEHYGIEYAEDGGKSPEGGLAIDVEPQYGAYGSDENEAVEQCVRSLSVYPYVLQFLYFLPIVFLV